MTHPTHDNLLGRAVEPPGRYAPEILNGIPRDQVRARLGLEPDAALPFHGDDVWNAWEFQWLDADRVPHHRVLRLTVPCSSPRMVESKSLKLYLHGFACARFDGEEEVHSAITHDLGKVCGAKVQVAFLCMEDIRAEGFFHPEGVELDRLCVPVPAAGPDDVLPGTRPGRSSRQRLYTNQFGSLCPVTGQPDWATLVIEFDGLPLNAESVQQHLLAFRNHPSFHEECVERIYLRFARILEPEWLLVQGFFTRRGGIDINPLRASAPGAPYPGRLLRQ